MNKFTETVFDAKTAFTLTENGAKTLISTGSKLVDQFGKAGNYRGRSLSDVFADQAAIWNEDAELALRFPYYLRMITRKVKVNKTNETDKVQNGQGARDESFKRLLWVAVNQKDVFNKNIWALPLVGSWKDVWTMMYYDIIENTKAIDHNVMFSLIAEGLASETHIDLVKKFMPRIKSQKKCTTDWTKTMNKLAKEFASFVGISVSEYNKLKASGKAHEFQKIICSRNYDKINWNKIPGRALNLLATSKFLSNHNLTDSYNDWIMKQPVANFTGYVFELGKKYREACGGYRWSQKQLPITVKHTLDAQFMGLVETARKNGKITENVWCALDTSGSMGCSVDGLNGVTCSDIANSLALFFAELNTGDFHRKIIMFDNTSYPYTIGTDSFCDNLRNLPSVPCGGTNFQSVVEEICKIRAEHPEIPLEDYPKTILVVSDMEFNATNYWNRGGITNFEYSKDTLKRYFPEEFVDNMKFIWWDVASRYGNNHYEGTANDNGAYFFSGFDGSIISMLLNEDAVKDEATGEVRRPTAEELVIKALNQEILTYIQL